MVIVQIPGAARESEVSSTTTPLVVLFERNDAIAVPLLSQLRLASYDVRSSRTPVELFDILSKHLVSLVLVDLGNATAGRREFWIALDAQRKGRAIQVMTFRYIQPGGFYDSDFDVAPRALADVEVHGAHEFQLVIEGVRQRLPLSGVPNSFGMSGPIPLGVPAPGMNPAAFPGGIAPIGAALGVPSPFMQNAPGAMPAFPGAAGAGGFDPYAATNPSAHAPTARPMPPVYPYAQPPFGPPASADPASQQPDFGLAQAAPFTPPPAQGWPFPPPVVSNNLPPTPQPAFGASPFDLSGSNSPFAHPVGTNPFSQEAEQSPFAQPYSANPFANDVPGGTGRAEPEVMTRGPSALSPMGTSDAGSSDPWWSSLMGAPASPVRAGVRGAGESDFAAGFAVAEPAPRPFQSIGGFNPRTASAVSDVWTPPDEDFDQQTGVVPEVAYQSSALLSPARPDPTFRSRASESRETSSDILDDTAPVPVPSRLPAVRRATPTETALGSVLVEGALLTSQRLEALKGIQQMLASVDMNFKLGELALLFKFLSPDQLLAALLVSRGLISPGQIAGLGRVKQELGATGMDYDLETLLVMFHILPAEQLRQLRAELASQQ